MRIAMCRWHWWHLTLLALIVLVALAPFDISVARLCYSHPVARPIVRVLRFIAFIASNGFGVLGILTTLVVLGYSQLSRVPRLFSASLGAGLLADVGKLCICRGRPLSIDLSTASYSSTFHGFLPFLSAGSHGQSFPSGHAATAAGLATALSFRFPRGRWFFLLAAAIAGVSRVIVHAHFPTDVAAGAMLGGMWAIACYQGFLGSAFLRIERKLEHVGTRRARSHLGKSAPRYDLAKEQKVSYVDLMSSENHRDAA
jgi:membrane-associated phospholipid phosphatase